MGFKYKSSYSAATGGIMEKEEQHLALILLATLANYGYFFPYIYLHGFM